MTTVKGTVRSRWDRMKVIVQLADAPEAARTQQQFKDECDINRIVRNAQRGIAPTRYARGEPQWGDFSEVPNLADAYETVARAEAAFMSLPAALRAELDNDPARINELTEDQIKRFRLGKEEVSAPSTPSTSSQPSSASPAAGQAASDGGVPPASKTKKSSKDDA